MTQNIAKNLKLQNSNTDRYLNRNLTFARSENKN